MNKKTPSSPLDVVTALMQERLKFDTWIATLEQRRDGTPANVYARVRTDYETRLAGVLDELKTHAAELDAQAERYTQRLVELAEQEQQCRDERAEAELRAHVGELSEGDWNATAKSADDALASIAAEQAVVGADLNRVHELLGAATASTPAMAAPAAQAPSAVDDCVEVKPVVYAEPGMKADPKSPVPAPVFAPEPVDARATPEQSSFDELAFLKSVVSPLASRTPVQPASSIDTRAAKAAPSPHITQDQSDTIGESLVSRAARPSQMGTFIRDDVDDPASQLVPRAEEPERLGDQPFAANVTGNHPIVLRPSGAVEQPKTLKCAECGAMNYPTEWYCERCGAELASM